jgi:hypothetical protein
MDRDNSDMSVSSRESAGTGGRNGDGFEARADQRFSGRPPVYSGILSAVGFCLWRPDQDPPRLCIDSRNRFTPTSFSGSVLDTQHCFCRRTASARV